MTDKFAILLFHSQDIYHINERFSLKKGENTIELVQIQIVTLFLILIQMI